MPLPRTFFDSPGSLFFRRCIWIVTLISLNITSAVQVTRPVVFPFLILICVLVAALCIIALWPTQHRFKQGLLSFAHTLTLIVYGICFWSDSGGLPLPCLAPALQLLSCQLLIPLPLQMLPMIAGVVIPLTAYPAAFLNPTVLIVTASSLILTVVVAPSSGGWEQPSDFSNVFDQQSVASLNLRPTGFRSFFTRTCKWKDPVTASNENIASKTNEESDIVCGGRVGPADASLNNFQSGFQSSYCDAPAISKAQSLVENPALPTFHRSGSRLEKQKVSSDALCDADRFLPDVEHDIKAKEAASAALAQSKAELRKRRSRDKNTTNSKTHTQKRPDRDCESQIKSESQSSVSDPVEADVPISAHSVAATFPTSPDPIIPPRTPSENSAQPLIEEQPTKCQAADAVPTDSSRPSVESGSPFPSNQSCNGMVYHDCDIGVGENLIERQYRMLKDLLDEEEQEKKKAQQELLLQYAHARELAHEYQVLKEYFDQGVERTKKVTIDYERQCEQIREMRLKYEILKERFDEQLETKQKADEELERQWKESLELKLKYAIVKGQLDEGSEKGRLSEDDALQLRGQASEFKCKYDILKQRFDEREERNKRIEEMLLQQHEENREIQRKYISLKDSFDHEIEGMKKVEGDLEAQCQMTREMKQKYDLLSERTQSAMEEKKKVDDELEQQIRQSRELKLKYCILKVHFDKGAESKKKFEDELEMQHERTKEMKIKYDMLKKNFDEGVEQRKHAEEALAQQCDQTRDLQQLYATLKNMFDKKKLQCSKQEENLSLAASHIKVLRWMLPRPDEVEEPPAFSEPLQTLARSENRSSELSASNPSHLLKDDSSITNISHDMRTPLTTAISVLEILLDDRVKLDELDRQDLLQKAWSALQIVLILVNNIIDFSRLRTANIRPVPKQVNVRRLAVQALRTLEIQATQSKIEFVLDAESSLPTSIHCDRILLHRVLVNLLANALKSTPIAGRVVLRIRWDAPRNLLQTSIIDNGSGMSPAELNALFKVPASGNPARAGTDLGLAICQHLVAKMNGSISGSSPGKDNGSTFSFDIPAAVSKNVYNSIDYGAFVIDDDPVRHHATVEMLKYAGVYILESLPENEKPGIVFVSAAKPSWESVVRYWKDEQRRMVCLLVPNTCSLKPNQVSRPDSILHSPVDIAELREVLRKLANSTIQSDTSSHPSHPTSNSAPLSDSKKEDILVLLAEDNQINHKLFLRQLANVGLANVHSAYDGAEALRLSQTNRYTIILMDCQMPVMDGYEATRQIRRIPTHVTTPIICLTADHSSENMMKCRECGMTDFFTKPMTLQNWQAIMSIAEKRLRHVDVMGSQT